jgi:acetylornithine deacetylase/succinyl-diaminopimelate desuccinylase-like protein
LPLTAEERADYAALPFDEARYLANIGVSAVYGEAGFTTLQRTWARPTCDVNGFCGGYQGEGPKTIIPARAMAKLTCRLVPHQHPQSLLSSLEAYLREQLLPGIEMEFTAWHSCPAVLCDRASPYMHAAQAAIEHGFGKRPVLIREGGSIPVVGTFKDLLGVDTLLLGWGQNTDNLHSPNEHFSLDAFHRGIRSSAWLWRELAN